jgi:hypothetical protein
MAAPARHVDGPRHYFLARAGVARDQHRAASAGHEPDRLDHLPHGPAFPDQQSPPRFRTRVRATAGLLPALPPVRRVIEQLQQALGAQRVAQIMEGAQAGEAHRPIERRLALANEHRDRRV